MLDWLLTHTPLLYLTQSLWRDEAFSILTAEKPIHSFIGTLNFEPPLYYILLHIWIKIFGESEIAARSLSLVGFCLATCVVIFWAEKRFKTHFLSWVFPILFFLNPMLLYYAFEIRAYGWFMFFATLSLYAYGQKNFKLTALANILAFYTHSYALFIPFVQFIHYLATSSYIKKKIHISNIVNDSYFQYLTVTILTISPWFIPIYKEMSKMRQTWYFPVDFQLVRSVLGNMITGYDGTPGGLWIFSTILSIIIIGLFILASRHKTDKREINYLLLAVFLPLSIVIGISFIKPLFVNRYLIYVTIAELFLMGYAITALKNPVMQKILTGLIVLFFVAVNIYFPDKKAKLDIRSTVMEANAIRGPNDVLYVISPLNYFETVYYTKDRGNVFLYNPSHSPFPWYVGDTAFSSSQMADQLPQYPKRAIMINADGTISISYKMNTPHIVEAPALQALQQ